MMYEEGLTSAVLPTPAVPDTAVITTVPPLSARPRSSPVSVASSSRRPAKPARVGDQRRADHVRGVGAPRQTPPGQQHLGAPARPAAGPARPYPSHRARSWP
jgi:hypothetical protein